ncbi:MAG: response regulator [Actinobacteria bacterium]|nr:response regulator [Actinomycetota bacterium]
MPHKEPRRRTHRGPAPHRPTATSSVERSAVTALAWSTLAFAAVYLALSLADGRQEWWLAFLESLGVSAVAFYQLWSRRLSLPVLWTAVVAAIALSGHLLPDPHRTVAGTAIAAVAAIGVSVVSARARINLTALLGVLWASQALFAATRGWVMVYQLVLFVVLAASLRSLSAAIRLSRDRYERLFEQAPIALWEEDFSSVAQWLQSLRRRGVEDLRAYLEAHPGEVDRAVSLVRVVDVNTAAVNLIEAEDAATVIGPLDPRNYTDETRPSLLEQFLTVWEGRSEMTTEVQGRTSTGQPIEAIMRWAAPLDPAGQPDYARVVVSIDDVSDAKAVQRELAGALTSLQAREEQLRTMVVAAPVVLLTIDRSGAILQAEGSGLEGIPDGDEMLGASIFARYADHPEVVEAFVAARRGEEMAVVLDRLGRRWDVRFRPVQDADGRVASVICVGIDVSAHYQMEQELASARRRNRMIVRHASDLIYTIGAEGYITFASASVEPTLGFGIDEVRGKAVAELVHPDDLGAIVAAAKDTGPGGSTVVIPHRVRRADGTWLPMEAKATNLLADPEMRAWVVTARDVTQQVEVRRQLEEARDAAEAATRAKSELLANVSHEIRTPMNAILGMTDLALDAGVDAEQHEYLTTVRASAESLLTIINDLLDLARVEAGRLSIEHVPFAVRATLEDVVRTMRLRAQQKGITLQARFAPGLPDWVSGDPGRLRQVVMNLVGNAVKFTDKGSVVLSARPLEGDLVEFSVEDTGIGIATGHLEAIFDAFEQADGSMTRRHGGTGLGLAISKKLVDAMGGRIEVQSVLGEGSTFTFTASLPAVAALAAVGGAGLAGGPALVVAERPSREALVRMVDRFGYEAIGVGSPAEALTTAAALHSDGRRVGAVIVDFGKPDVEECRRLAASEVLAGTPVVAIVAAGRRGDGARFRAAGVRAYLTRPLEPADLREALAAIASGGAPVDILITRHWLRERRRPLRVLLADDSPTNRLVASRVLEKRGHDVAEVGDGAEALAALDAARYDVVLMDVQMPGMDGLEATRQIRDRERRAGAGHVPVIALTAHAMEADRQRCLAAGMDGYLAKPFSSEDLVGAVEGGAAIGAFTLPGPTPAAAEFLAGYPALVDGLEEAVAAGDLESAAALAGRLEIGLRALGADDAAALAGRIAEGQGAGSGREAYEALSEALDRLEPQMAAIG